ncbi:MAG: hypothetical protein PVH92_07590, partial [Anaerolineales bacterium]
DHRLFLVQVELPGELHMMAQDPHQSTSGFPPEFSKLEQRLNLLKEQYRRGDLSDEAYQSAVQALTIQDSSGTTWWLGGESGLWQRWDGRQWVRDNPPVAAKDPAAKTAGRTRAMSPIVMGCGVGVLVVAIVTAVLLIGGWREYKLMPKIVEGAQPDAASVAGYSMSSAQTEIFGDIGPPQAFTLLFYEEELLDGSYGDVRFETWDYYNAGISYTFINGELAGEDPLEVEIVGEIYPIPYRPDQFHAYMSLDEVLASAGLDRYLVVPLEKELVDGGEVYYADELTFGLKNDELLYIEALALEVTE